MPGGSRKPFSLPYEGQGGQMEQVLSSLCPHIPCWTGHCRAVQGKLSGHAARLAGSASGSPACCRKLPAFL